MSASFTECMHCFIWFLLCCSFHPHYSWTYLEHCFFLLQFCQLGTLKNIFDLLPTSSWHWEPGSSWTCHLLFLLFAFSCFLLYKLPRVLEHLTFSENLNLHWIFLEPAVKTKVGLIKSRSVFDTCMKWMLQGLEILRHFCFCDGQTGRTALTQILVNRVTLACPPEKNSFCISCHVSLICLLHFFNEQL